MKSFIFGKGTPWTYDELQRKRKIADALQIANSDTPRNVGEGLSAIGRALAYRSLDRKATKRDGELKSEFDNSFGEFMGGYGGGEPAMAAQGGGAAYAPPMQPRDPNSPDALASDTMAALGKGATPEGIKAGLVARGMPEHIADGFIMNFQDESGMNPGINEAAPTVPGSRGGFGLAQWTGPRRKALEAFAAAKGMPVSDPGIQMDFLMTELQGPESGAWAKISGAQNSGEAGAAIVNSFLRPAEQHRATREAEYLGAGGGQSAPEGGGMPAGMDMGKIAELAGNPYATPGQKAVLEALMQQQTQAMDPMAQLELRKAQLELAQMQNPQADIPKTLTERKALAAEAGLQPGSPEYSGYIATGNLATPGGGTEYGLTPILGRDASGKVVVMQIGKDGVAVQTQMPDGVSADLGLAPMVKAEGTAIGKAAGEADVAADSLESKMVGLDEVVADLEVLADKATYTMGGQLYDAGRKQLDMEPREAAVARSEYVAMVDNQVLPLLRDTFGAAFTVKEGETLRATLGDPDKSPKEKKAVLNAFIAQKKRDLVAMKDQAGQGVLNAPEADATGSTKRLKYNPATGELE